MKRLCCLLLAAALVWLCGCQSTSSSSQSTDVEAQGPGLGRHALVTAAHDALLQGDVPARVRLAAGTDEPYAGHRVETTSALLAGIADALYYGAQEEDASGASDATEIPPEAISDAEEGSTMIEVTMPDASLTVILRKRVDGCGVYVSLEDKDTALLYPDAVYQTVLALAEENLVPDTLEVTGELLPLQTPSAPTEGMTAQWLECAGGLAALYTWTPDENSSQQTSAFEIFDPGTGESLYYKEIGAKALRMEAASFAACDTRVLMEDGAVWYLNSQSPEAKPYYFYLPKDLRDRLLAPWPQDRAVFRSFDGGTGQGAVWAVVDEEGLTWARRSRGNTIANDVIIENLPEGLYEEGDAPPQFGEVHLVNGGATLVATVMLPGDPMGLVGLFTYSISSGAMGWYFGMVSPPMADLRFVSGTEVVIAGESEIYHLNMATGEESTTPAPENVGAAFTTDYVRYIFPQYTLNLDGTSTYALYADDAEEPFFTATDGDTTMMPRGTPESQVFSLTAQPRGITEAYLILTLRENGEDTWHLARRA